MAIVTNSHKHSGLQNDLEKNLPCFRFHKFLSPMIDNTLRVFCILKICTANRLQVELNPFLQICFFSDLIFSERMVEVFRFFPL